MTCKLTTHIVQWPWETQPLGPAWGAGEHRDSGWATVGRAGGWRLCGTSTLDLKSEWMLSNEALAAHC